jgi:hypothetical protein
LALDSWGRHGQGRRHRGEASRLMKPEPLQKPPGSSGARACPTAP